MRPFRACDIDERYVKYPVMVMAKIDRVRALNNKFNSQLYGNVNFTGFDGEAVTGDNLCHSTTSALTTTNGLVPVKWCLFDYIVPGFNDTITIYGRKYAN